MRPKWDRHQGRPEPIRALNAIRELENGEPLVDIREYAPKLVIAREQVIPFVRKRVAEMVHQATLLIPDGIRLGLVEGWRPIERQQRIYDFLWKCAVEAYPNRDHAALRRTVCRWVAPTDQKAPPGHCTGAAVDVWLLDGEGKEMNVWAPYSRFEASPMFTLGLTEEAHKLRMTLYNAMMSVGFSNCRDEWWHYSYGDAGYAVRTAQTTCVYGLTKLDKAIYEELEKLAQESFKDRPNPFLAA